MSSMQIDKNGLLLLLEGGGAFVNAQELLEDVSAEDAVKEFEGVNHSIARVVAHMQYWQAWTYAGATGEALAYPITNEDSFPVVQAADWEGVRTDFLACLHDIKQLCNDAEVLARPFTDLKGGGHEGRTVGVTMLYTVALHNAHHYGQIITLRQLMGNWPPKAGGVTW